MGLEIFISYSSIDLNTIETIIKPLKEQEGVNIFCAEYSLNPGQKISNTIIQKTGNDYEFPDSNLINDFSGINLNT